MHWLAKVKLESGEEVKEYVQTMNEVNYFMNIGHEEYKRAQYMGN